MRIGIGVERLPRQVDGKEEPVRTIQHVDAHFLLHDIALVVEILH
ncbi:MAG TPA: hypothetical protein VL990_06430 [Acidobacteriaceae bacterium]|nr:hypothetical protein [Acidobacteriaceae bacterium]